MCGVGLNPINERLGKTSSPALSLLFHALLWETHFKMHKKILQETIMEVQEATARKISPLSFHTKLFNIVSF